jgi:hypothetical protein
MARPRLPVDLRAFLKLLNSARVEYLLVGGFAVGYYGYPRATGDLDIWVDVSDKSARKADCFARRARVKFDGLRINLINFEDPKKNKAASGRPKDLDDLQALEQ